LRSEGVLGERVYPKDSSVLELGTVKEEEKSEKEQ